jgi:hypothetical protein
LKNTIFPKAWNPTGISVKIHILNILTKGIQTLLGFLIEHDVVSIDKKKFIEIEREKLKT